MKGLCFLLLLLCGVLAFIACADASGPSAIVAQQAIAVAQYAQCQQGGCTLSIPVEARVEVTAKTSYVQSTHNFCRSDGVIPAARRLAIILLGARRLPICKEVTGKAVVRVHVNR